MSDKDNIININSHQNKEKNKNMIVVIAIIAAILAVLTWNLIIKDQSYTNSEIQESRNISYNSSSARDISPIEVINFIEQSELSNKPVLIYLYTTWCKACAKQLPVMNEIARKFQNTDLNVLFIAIDRDITKDKLGADLSGLQEVYFEPRYISDRNGFKDLLKTKSISFKGRIPFIAMIDRNSKLVIHKSGYKGFKYINKRVMKSLFKDNES